MAREEIDLEHLLRFRLKDGSSMDLYRDGSTVKLCKGDHCMILPRATAQQTVDLCTMLEDAGAQIETQIETDEETENDG